MSRYWFAVSGAVLLGAVLVASAEQPQPQSAPPAKPALVVAHPAAPIAPEAQNALVAEYCATCHSERGKAGGLSLAAFDAAAVDKDVEVAEKMIRKLRAGMMPPAGAKRPDEATLSRLASAFETRIDRSAATRPNPGRRAFQRLNRAEYARAIQDLLELDVDVTALLPADTISHGFDNIADTQAFSPTLLEGYLRAATRIAYLATGDPSATASETTYKVPRTQSQLHHVEGAPFGTRGGTSLVHIFPADGEYTFRMMLHSIPTGQLYGSTTHGEQIEVAINGERKAVLSINPQMSEADPNGMNLQTPPIFVKAGPQRISAAFLRQWEGPVDDLVAPIEYTLADSQIGAALGVTTVPHLRDLSIGGPHKVTGISDTPSRRRIFVCRPTAAAEEAACASTIIKQLATQAYRRPLGGDELSGLLDFYRSGREEGDFESGVRRALQAILASPSFLFRLERANLTARPGENYRIADLDLASRLSFFLWGAAPDDTLLAAATAGQLRTSSALQAQVQRMLADPRSEAMATRFAAQWLRLQDIDKIHPDALLYPQYDYLLAESMRKETELFFESLVRENRSLLELLTANYTFVNERLALHYGIPNITGHRFQRVTLSDENRRGILGHGSVLMMTSVADRTSAVLRGKWIMEVLLGSPPPPPPPNVPALEETKSSAGAKMLSTRERMEEHRKNPACTSCHKVIDPLGLALENFDVTGQWRIKDNEVPVDPSGTLYDGSPLSGPVGLRQALLKHKDAFVFSFTESLLTYALGRRVETYDMPAVRAIAREAAKNDYRLSSFIQGVIESAAFQMSQAEAVATTVEDRQ
ncbi:MAG: DUF1592 domain-containing protein [Acidobacteria bacterium]|nr:DUF1592 domain-containing protein [Acidobacteriota bacterium]